MLTNKLQLLRFGTALSTAVLLSSGAVHAREIRNVATMRWDTGTTTRSLPSNEVTIKVQDAPPEPVTVSFFQFSGVGTGQPMPTTNTVCMGNNGAHNISLNGAFAIGEGQAPNLVETSAIRAGAPIILSIKHDADNTNSNVVDSLQVTIVGTVSVADRETIVLTETGQNTGVFMGYINTSTVPPEAVAGDCLLSVNRNDTLHVIIADSTTSFPIGTGDVDILVDPFGIVFDSDDGAPVNGATVTLIDNATGQPAQVFGDDGVSAFPSQIISGGSVTDASGQVYDFTEGFYRFPFARPGDYRIVVTPPAPYSWTSDANEAHLETLMRPDGQAMEIIPASFGQTLTLATPEAVRVDIPVDKLSDGLVLTKRAHVSNAAPGDFVRYDITVASAGRNNSGIVTITDDLPSEMRLRADSVTYNGAAVVAQIAPDGGAFSITAPALTAGQTGRLSYIAEVRSDARSGTAVNRVTATDSRGGTSNTADAPVRIEQDLLTSRFTITGRVVEGGCVDPDKAKGIPGVRVMLEDGTYTVTDMDGRYHFEGIHPGKHVVQIDTETLPLDQAALDCPTNNRTAESPISRFVEGRGGSLKRADFHTHTVAPRATDGAAMFHMPEALSDTEAAGSETDWLEGLTPGTEFLFPATGYNPRLRSTRIAIKHPAKMKVELTINGQPVPPLNFDGARTSANRKNQVSLWRGVPLEPGENKLVARVMKDDGTLHQEITQSVHLSGAPMTAKLLPDMGSYRADGISRPVIAVRLTDREGRPIPHGTRGAFQVPSPYQAAIEVDAQQARQLAGMDRAPTGWEVVGDDGIAYIQLEPTTASGSVQITFPFADGEVKKEQKVDVWLDAGNRPWTVVALASISYGFNQLTDELSDPSVKKRTLDGRLAFYAKGKLHGKWMATVAYDSDKNREDTLFAGAINPTAYYTIYADRAEQRYDAASLRKLYARVERPNFYAMFGDFSTNINDPQLARYQRSLTGFKAQYGTPNINATVFYAETDLRYKRDEIQGNGLTGPYALSSRFAIPNSETITLQVRDRLQSQNIVSERRLSRYIDYDIDYASGTVRFKEPVLSRDFDGNPQFIVAEFEVEGNGRNVTSAGGRAAYTTSDEKLRIGATAIHDENDTAKTEVYGADVRIRPNTTTEVRAEYAASRGKPMPNQSGSRTSGEAWLVEAEHHSKQHDLLIYARQQDGSFGVGQLNASENATRKFGVDAKTRLSSSVSLGAQAWQEDQLGQGARRRAGSVDIQVRDTLRTATVGVIYADDSLSDGTSNRSTLLKFSGSHKVGKKLYIDAGAEMPIDDKDASVDFPARYQLGARFMISNAVQLVAGYERAEGGAIVADTFRAGFDVAPWKGGRILATAGQQEITEYGPRSFAAYGLKQSFQVTSKLTVDFSVDANSTLNGVRRIDVLNPEQPVATGGFLSSGNLLTEDFTAVSAGANYANGPWSVTSRIEYRDGESEERYGATAGFIRQIGEGEAIGGLARYTHARSETNAQAEVAEVQFSWARRPADSRWSWLAKAELRHDEVKGAVAGATAPVSGSFIINGDARSRRAIGMVTINYTPVDEWDDEAKKGMFHETGEYSFFWGTRYVSERFGDADVDGWSNVFGLDARIDVSKRLDLGFAGTVRVGNDFRSVAYSGGPMVTLAPEKNMNIRLGYNVVGYRDRDFEEAKYTRQGPYIQLEVKLDQTTFKDLGF